LDKGSTSNRASMSGEEPAGYPTIIRTGLLGQAGAVCASRVGATPIPNTQQRTLEIV
jgi:hypothetical protein